MQLAELRRQMKVATMQNKALQDQLEVGRQVASVMMSPDSMPLKLMPKDKNMPMVHATCIRIWAWRSPPIRCRQSPLRSHYSYGLSRKTASHERCNFPPRLARPDCHRRSVNMPMTEIAMLAVTEEPAGGSPQPTTAIAWSAQVN